MSTMRKLQTSFLSHVVEKHKLPKVTYSKKKIMVRDEQIKNPVMSIYMLFKPGFTALQPIYLFSNFFNVDSRLKFRLYPVVNENIQLTMIDSNFYDIDDTIVLPRMHGSNFKKSKYPFIFLHRYNIWLPDGKARSYGARYRVMIRFKLYKNNTHIPSFRFPLLETSKDLLARYSKANILRFLINWSHMSVLKLELRAFINDTYVFKFKSKVRRQYFKTIKLAKALWYTIPNKKNLKWNLNFIYGYTGLSKTLNKMYVTSVLYFKYFCTGAWSPRYSFTKNYQIFKCIKGSYPSELKSFLNANVPKTSSINRIAAIQLKYRKTSYFSTVSIYDPDNSKFSFLKSREFDSSILIKHNFQTAWTYSVNSMLSLYGLNVARSLKKNFMALMGTIVRRFLVLMGATKLVFICVNFLSSFEIFYKTILTPSQEIWYHPVTYQILADYSYSSAKILKNVYLKNKLSALREDFENLLRAKVEYLTNDITPNLEELHSEKSLPFNKKLACDASIRDAFIAHELSNFQQWLTQNRRSFKTSKNKEYSSHSVDVLYFNVHNNVKNLIVYKKKVRSIKKRLKKRIVKINTRRLWVF